MHFNNERMALEMCSAVKLVVMTHSQSHCDSIFVPGVDIEAATRLGIKVARIPSAGTGNALSCAEHAIYLMLSLLRNQVFFVVLACVRSSCSYQTPVTQKLLMSRSMLEKQ